MPLPVTFALLPSGDNPASLLDTQFSAVAGFVVIPCFVTGQNVLELAPFADAPLVPAYTDLSPVFAFEAAQSSTGNVTVNVANLGAFPLFKDNGATLVGAGDLVAGLAYQIAFLSALNGGAGGFFLSGGAPGPQGPPGPAPSVFTLTTSGIVPASALATNVLLGNGWGTLPPPGIAAISTQTFTANGSYTATSGTVYAIVEVFGAGGAGGSVQNSGAVDAGPGGGQGAYGTAVFPAADLLIPIPVEVGAGGAPNTTGAPGGNGGPSAFGAFIQCGGGGGGSVLEVGRAGSGGTGSFSIITGKMIFGAAGGSASLGPSSVIITGGRGAGVSMAPRPCPAGITRDGPDALATYYGQGSSGGATNGASIPGTWTRGGQGGPGLVFVTEFRSS